MDQPRREFLKASLVASAATLTGLSASAETSTAGREYYELRAYRLKSGAPHDLLDGYLANALIPALNARGIASVGIFTEPEAKDGPAVWVLIPHPSLKSWSDITASLNADPAVVAAGGAYFDPALADNPAYDRIDSWLFLAFAGLPRMVVPELTRAGKPRILELRTYESFNEVKALKKVDMFNAGEIDVMQQVGLSPVFFGQALAGSGLPQLTYMLCGPDREAHKEHWTGFGNHPVWVALKVDPQYADTVSKITARFFVPTAYSQI
ncbi:MAG TPA: NIPSNAP family protein [Opitutaceae bacterium]|nr:NIPSNAP family protein [Opitutaceae bacterium]